MTMCEINESDLDRAYGEGHQAYHDGYKLKHNPYKMFSKLWQEWRSGRLDEKIDDPYWERKKSNGK